MSELEQLNTQATKHTNIKLLYEYTEGHLVSVNRSIDILTTKLNIILGLSAGLILSLAAFPVSVTLLNKLQYYWLLGWRL